VSAARWGQQSPADAKGTDLVTAGVRGTRRADGTVRRVRFYGTPETYCRCPAGPPGAGHVNHMVEFSQSLGPVAVCTAVEPSEFWLLRLLHFLGLFRLEPELFYPVLRQYKTLCYNDWTELRIYKTIAERKRCSAVRHSVRYLIQSSSQTYGSGWQPHTCETLQRGVHAGESRCGPTCSTS
jgi:hypothetical protein